MTKFGDKFFQFQKEGFHIIMASVQCSQICSPFDKNQFSSERRKRVEAKKFDEIKIKVIERKHKIS
jgi:hypothetical protein